MASISVGYCTINNIFTEAKAGEIKIPQFQRKFVWSVKDSAKLLDSIIKGYPVGALIYWKTKEKLRTVRNIGNFSFPNPHADDYVYYVLDGQQRITSLLACLLGETIDEDDFSQVFVDLSASEDNSIVTADMNSLQDGLFISLKDLYENKLTYIFKKFGHDEKLIEKIGKYHEALTNFQFSKITLSDASLPIATEVFTRINTTGKGLSMFEIMCAKMYSERRPVFDLYEKMQTKEATWKDSGYEIPENTVLQAVGACLCKSSKGSDILSLDKTEFISHWNDVCKAFDKTIDFFKNGFKIPVSKLVPYDALYVPFVYYFYKTKKQRPPVNEKKYLTDYFWRSAFSSRFTEGVVSKINEDLVNVIDKIIKNQVPTYDHGLVISKSSIQANGVFSTGSAYIKAILCIFCAQNPVSFKDGTLVSIDNSWLSQGNSKNYHHFFPKDYMKKNQPSVDESLVNHIVNITIVDGWLNKTQIKAKAPSVYMSEFAKDNPNINDHMKTHLIDDINGFGIPLNDYDLFFNSRIKKIHGEMTKLLVKKPNDDFKYE